MTCIMIDDEMRAQAKIEAQRRDQYIKHHFEVEHLSYTQRDEIGFLGEFACCKLLGIDWKSNIRENYFTIDDFDVYFKGKKIDIKTETVPATYATAIVNRTINDNLAYGRRLINAGQWGLLVKYEIVIFGLFIRDFYDKWYPIGFRDTAFLLQNYHPQMERPYGGTYPFKAAPIKTSDLQPLKLLTDTP